jgi:phosphate transport system substrate-binding protein
MIVSDDVWQAGVRSLSRKEIIDIYEGKTTNWNKLGGPDRKIKFFNPEKGKGPWEFFVGWLYGEVRKAPIGTQFEQVATADETTSLIEFNGGALAVVASNHADRKAVHALAIRLDDGTLASPTPAEIRKQHYPLARPIVVITAFRPSGLLKKTIDFMLSSEGQEFVRRADIVPIVEEQSE